MQSEKGYSPPSGALFSMYLGRAEEEDRRMIENWKGDADGILVFTGLFSASVATFLGNTYQKLQLNSQDASAFYLSRIYQQSASDNGSQVSVPSTISDPATFSPSTTTVWINALWFLSLVISLTCALLATMLQQWARHYLRVTQTRYQPYKRARIRSFYAEGVKKFQVSWAVDVLPALLHLSVFLFYAGLSVLLFTINFTIFRVVVSWVALCLSLYVVITILSAVFPNSPYRTPLSTLCWMAPLYILRPPVNVLRHTLDLLSGRFGILHPVWAILHGLGASLQVLVANGMLKSAEKTAMMQSSDVGSRALTWTYDSLDEDHELEQFFAGVPGLLRSRTVEEPELMLMGADTPDNRRRVTHDVQRRRFKICSEAAFALMGMHTHPSAPSMFDYVGGTSMSDFVLSLERMASDQDLVLAAKCMAHLFSQWAWSSQVASSAPTLSRITGFPLVRDHDCWSVGQISCEATLLFIRHIALPYLDGPSHITRTTALTATLRYLPLRPPPSDWPNELRNSFCEIWNRAINSDPDKDEHKVVLHILACLYPASTLNALTFPDALNQTIPLPPPMPRPHPQAAMIHPLNNRRAQRPPNLHALPRSPSHPHSRLPPPLQP
ncbi:hypothetical protein BC834DRAFT_493519 [Gloeopeniophorella convolvens]|nr:hypothetical protein BC834DRAFT_493519 [Gloeopeniophorella convolvens]